MKHKGGEEREFGAFVFDHNHPDYENIGRAGAWSKNMPNFHILRGRGIGLSNAGGRPFRLFFVKFRSQTDPSPEIVEMKLPED